MKWLSFLTGWQRASSLSFYNTLSRSTEVFSLPAPARHVRVYNCGPTVYGPQHVGNLSAAVFADTLRRVLEWNGYAVKQVINITDFGHLISDGDEGEDKMMKGLRAAGKEPTMENMHDLASRFMEHYLRDIAALNVATDEIRFPRASEHVPAQIAMIQTLVEKGYAYETSDGVYFETAHFPAYGALGGVDTAHQKEGARVAVNAEKHGASDFALWKKSAAMGWDSPWGKGFPGWHIECSAMIHSLLGKQIDIHTGGIEHISVHHNNEIAQSEAATGKRPFSRFWMHRAHIRMNDAKMAKSDGNVAYLADVLERGYHPLALRYWFLTNHYRTPANFTWEALDAAQKAFLRLRRFVDTAGGASAAVPARWKTAIVAHLNDDLDTPGAIATLWDMSKAPDVSAADVKAAILEADRVLGLGFAHEDELATRLYGKFFGATVAADELPEDIRALMGAREAARHAKDWAKADTLRAELAEKGYRIEDGEDGPRAVKQG